MPDFYTKQIIEIDVEFMDEEDKSKHLTLNSCEEYEEKFVLEDTISFYKERLKEAKDLVYKLVAQTETVMATETEESLNNSLNDLQEMINELHRKLSPEDFTEEE